MKKVQPESRQAGGPSAVEMLTQPVSGPPQDDPGLSEGLYLTMDLTVGPGNALDSDPDQEGPPGSGAPGR